MIITIRNHNRAISRYCHENISPKRYYLHNSHGGRGWRIYNENNNWYLEVPDHYATIICLKFPQ